MNDILGTSPAEDMKALLVRAPVKQGEVAERLKLAPSTVSGYLNGDTIPAGFEARFRKAVHELAAEWHDARAEELEADAKSHRDRALLRRQMAGAEAAGPDYWPAEAERVEAAVA